MIRGLRQVAGALVALTLVAGCSSEQTAAGGVGGAGSDASCSPESERSCGTDVGICTSGRQICGSDGLWGPCEESIEPADEICNGLDDDCDGDIDEDCSCDPGAEQGCGSTVETGACQQGTQVCGSDGLWGPCDGAIEPTDESCNGLDDDCDGDTDEGLATDLGEFAGCANYRYLIDRSIAWLDGNAASGGATFKPSSVDDAPSMIIAAFGLVARAELYLRSEGLALPAGTRQRIIDQALEQADALWTWEASQPTPQSLRQGVGNAHACRGWFGNLSSYESAASGQSHPAYTVTTYSTGPVLYGLALLAKALYSDPPDPSADYLAHAATYNSRVNQVLGHWFTTQSPNDHFFAASAGDGTENWFCETEFEDDCSWGGQRYVKWNKQTWMWRAAAIWNDNARSFEGGAAGTRRTRAMRFARWMKKDMLASSGPWSNTSPYVWHSWADWSSTAIWNYIEDASHGAWDVGLMAEAWWGDWRYDGSYVDSDDESYVGDQALMGTGSASRFRHTYLDNLAIADDPCVWAATDGSKSALLITGRRRALSEWVPMAAGDTAFLLELQEDLTGSCDGYDPLAPSVPRPEMALAFVRLWTEARQIRGQ